jgi:DNA polymerase III alpha subunit
MDAILSETFGIMIYQEDVTKVAMALAGFSIEDADELRKVLEQETQAAAVARLLSPVCGGMCQTRAHDVEDSRDLGDDPQLRRIQLL